MKTHKSGYIFSVNSRIYLCQPEDYPGRLWSLLLWRYSRPAWTRSCAACCRWPCFGGGAGLDDPQRSLPTPTILWFCDSVNHCLVMKCGTYDCTCRNCVRTEFDETPRCTVGIFQRCWSHGCSAILRTLIALSSFVSRFSKEIGWPFTVPRRQGLRSAFLHSLLPHLLETNPQTWAALLCETHTQQRHRGHRAVDKAKQAVGPIRPA